MSDQIVSASKVISASATTIFDVLADPSRHAEFDGSDMVQSSRGDAQRLELGSKFGMDMKHGWLPYRIKSTVVEFEPDRLIAWAHLGKHRWRYALEPIEGDPGRTTVTESFDYSTALSPRLIELIGYPERHRTNIEQTLERLADLVES